jgi:hypothetical protein
MPWLLDVGAVRQRHAGFAHPGSAPLNAPPRTTRVSPLSGPFGSVTAAAL